MGMTSKNSNFGKTYKTNIFNCFDVQILGFQPTLLSPGGPKSPPLMTSLTKSATLKQKFFRSAGWKICHVF